MDYALETHALGKRYGKRWALQECNLQIPRGQVVGLVGLNGAGKTTLLHLAMGIIEPSAGKISVSGIDPRQQEKLLPLVGFMAQEHPLYRGFSVNDLFTMGRKTNKRWDDIQAREILFKQKIDLKQRIGKLSGGQRALIALLMVLAKQPDILLLDEPFASVDPLMRRELARLLMEVVAERNTTIVISSHIVSDLEQICDHLVVISSAHVQVASDVEELRQTHKLLIGPREGLEAITRRYNVLQESSTGRQSHVLVRSDRPIEEISWQVQDVTLEEIILAYLAQTSVMQEKKLPSVMEVLK